MAHRMHFFTMFWFCHHIDSYSNCYASSGSHSEFYHVPKTIYEKTFLFFRLWLYMDNKGVQNMSHTSNQKDWKRLIWHLCIYENFAEGYALNKLFCWRWFGRSRNVEIKSYVIETNHMRTNIVCIKNKLNH